MSGNETADESSPPLVDGKQNGFASKLYRWLWASRRGRLLALLIAMIAVVLIGLSANWIGDHFRAVEITAAPTLSANEMFTAACQLVRDQQLKVLQLSECEVNDAMIPEIAKLDGIDTVILDLGIVTDKGVESITKLPGLQHLRLRLSPITDDGLKTISQCSSLWYLNLPHADCTSAGVAQLQNLKSLRQLRLGSKRLGNDVCNEIAKLKGLRGIHLIGVPVTDEGLETLAQMPYLESLYLDDSGVTEAGWERLFRDHPDLHVHINQQHHDRDPKRHNHHD